MRPTIVAYRRCRLQLHRLLLGLLLLLCGLFGLSGPAAAQTGGTVYVVQVRNTIDLGLAPYLERVIETAAAADAAAVVIEINTPGGRLDAALQMRDVLLATPLRTIAYVDREAFSAGALIALAADELYMAPGAVIGAATPIEGLGGETADPKTISAVASAFRATAEANGRDPQIAAAMVDPQIAISDLVAAGDLLSMTAEEALAIDYIAGIVADRDALLAATGLPATELIETRPGLAENLVRFLTTPVVASLLIAFGVLFIMADLLSGGIGLLAALGLGLIVLFYWGHLLAGLAGWESIALVLVGLVLIGVEIFVVPGFGVAGILGIIALVAGLMLTLIGGQIVTGAEIVRAAATLFGAFLGIIVGAFLLVRYLPRFGKLQGLILQTQVGLPSPAGGQRPRWGWLGGPRLERSTTPTAAERPSLRGATGVALSDLRPSGLARIADQRIDVVTQGDYIRAGEAVEVIADQGYRRVVRRLSKAQQSEAQSV